MKVPLSWLKEFVSTEDHTPEAISHLLTMTGLEVEGIDPVPLRFENVVVAKVKETQPHPDADRLCIAKVDNGNEELQIVCGASNCRAGITVALAQVGGKLFDAEGKVLKIKKSKVRGVESFGMLCSEDELGLADSSDGIVELDDSLCAGTPLESLYGDVVFDIALTPNLAHCASITGIARELAAADSKFFKFPETPKVLESGESITSHVSISVEDIEKCPRYACRLIRGVKVGPSPAPLRRRLEACGVRSINNVVDATNYVLMETGHPLHAFDFSCLEDGKIIVKTASAGDTFVTLDGEERTLSDETLMICDNQHPVAIAGVMGGENSEVGDCTVDVLLESAYFLPTNIRRSSKRLQLLTEASKRYERGCDPNIVLHALDRAAVLIQELAGGEIAAGVIDEKKSDFVPLTITCRFSRINQLLGTQLAVSEVERVFNSLGFEFSWDQEDTFTVTVPTYRVDISREVDLIEEVARIYGFDNIAREPGALRFPSGRQPDAPIFRFGQQVRHRLRSEGLQEMMTCDLISPELSQLGDVVQKEKTLISVSNPTSNEQSVLRPSLLPGLLNVVKYNISHYMPDASGFEVGKVHMRVNDQFCEQSAAAILLTGKQSPSNWDGKPREVDFFDLKGHIENLLSSFDVADVRFVASSREFFHPGRQAEIMIGSMTLGILGEVHPSILRQLDISQRVYLAEINLHDLFQVRLEGKRMTDLPQFPGSDRDWTLTLTEETPVQDVFDAIESLSSKLLADVRLLDVYRSEQLGADRKNLSFRFTYRSPKKTLSQEAVEREHGRIEKQTKERLAEHLITS